MPDFVECHCITCRAMARRKQGQQLALLDAIPPDRSRRLKSARSDRQIPPP